MAPEALNGEPQTTASDIYAIGGVILHVMSGHPPWRQTPSFKVIHQVLERVTPPREEYTISEYAPYIVDEIWILMERCWSFKPPDRPNALEVLNTLIDLHEQSSRAEADSADHGDSLTSPNREVTGSNYRNTDKSTPTSEVGRKDFSTAIKHYQEVLNLRPPGHPKRDSSMHRLASLFWSRYNREENPDDLRSAIQHYQETLDLRPPGHPKRDVSLRSLACSLSSRYDRDKNPDDLQSAIQYHQKALDLRPPGHPKRDLSLYNLAYALEGRYGRNKNPEDLNSAI